MSTVSKWRGHLTEFVSNVWRFVDTKRRCYESRPCRHCNKKPVIVNVRIASDLSYTHKLRWAFKSIDACIAPIVKALQNAGICMRGSCCGHGESIGDISLQDGRHLLILPIDKLLEGNRAKKYSAIMRIINED